MAHVLMGFVFNTFAVFQFSGSEIINANLVLHIIALLADVFDIRKEVRIIGFYPLTSVSKS
jgi:hypothetical protein